MTTQPEPTDPTPRQMTCVRMLYVMEDGSGATWLAVEEPSPGPGGGAMSHLLPGDTTEVEGDDPDQVTVLVSGNGHEFPQRLPAYRVSAALLPTGEAPAPV